MSDDYESPLAPRYCLRAGWEGYRWDYMKMFDTLEEAEISAKLLSKNCLWQIDVVSSQLLKSKPVDKGEEA